MKAFKKYIGIAAISAAIFFALAALSLAGCNIDAAVTVPPEILDPGDIPSTPIVTPDPDLIPSAPTVTLDPASVPITNAYLTQTVPVGGTATGTITLNTATLPAEVTATVSDATITVTGVRPTTDVPPVTGSFTVGVTREGVTATLTIEVNLTTAWVDPLAPLTLSPDTVTINDGNLTATVTVGGTASGTVTVDASALPAEVTATVSDTTITITGVRPATNVPAILDTFTVAVSRAGETQNLTVAVNITTTWIAPTVTFSPDTVTINDGNLTATVTVGGTATGTVTVDASALPAEVTATVSGTTITITGVRPIVPASTITGSFTVGVTREGITEDFKVDVNLSTPILSLSPSSITINNGNLTQTVTVSGTANGTVFWDTTALPAEVTAIVSGATITITGIRPTTEVAAIHDSYTIGVTQEGITENLTVTVRLTTTWTGTSFDFNTGSAGLYVGAPESLNQYSTPIPGTNANDVPDAVTYINANADEYTLLLDNNTTVSTTQMINTSNVKLTIIGISSERTISLTAASRMFWVGASGQSGISLTLGNNITLVGYASNSWPVVGVLNSAAFTMLDGSKVTGNGNSYSAFSQGSGSAVYISAATFTMKGGTITNNNETSTATNNFFRAGGLFIDDNASTIRLEGGSITGNTGVCGDVSFYHTSTPTFIISGNTAIGRLTLTASNTANRTTLTIESGWTGTIGQLDLFGNNSDMPTVIGYWQNQTVLVSADMSNALSKISNLGNFRSNLSSTSTQAIGPTYAINASGVLE